MKSTCLKWVCFLLFGCLLLSACSDGAGAKIKYDISTVISSFDPQYASAEDARLVVRNIFEGLYTPRSDGPPVPAAAESLSLSEDGLTATVRLREGLKWSTRDASESFPLTSGDFAFALQRLFTPDFPSPYAGDFVCLKNAGAILRGEMDVSALGVSAPDDRTLVLSLEYPVNNLPQLLCSTAAIPCPKEFFEETRGRYGLDDDTLLYNGPFVLYYWEKDFVQLRRNTQYYDLASVLPASVMMEVHPDADPQRQFDGDNGLEGRQATRFSRFQQRKTDAAVLSYDEWSRLEGDRWSSEQFEDTVWVLIFNQRDPFLADAQVRRALVHSIDHRTYAPTLAIDLVDTNVFLPPSLRLGGESYRKLAGFTGMDLYLPDAARAGFDAAAERLGYPDEPFVLLAASDSTHPLTAGTVQKMWRQALSYNAVVRLAKLEDLEKAVRSGNFQAAIMPMRPDSQQPGALLGDFSSASSRNYAGYSSEEYDRLLSRAASADSLSDQLAAYQAAENLLIEDAVIAPLYFQSHYYVMAPGVSGVQFSPFAGETNFKSVRKR